MEIASWPVGVNRIITSDSKLSIGEGALIADKSENGQEISRLASSGAPDKWTVVMWFSNSKDDAFYKAHGKSERDTFLNWFKYNIRMGTKPFYFADIHDKEARKQAVYKILSNGLPNGTPTGNQMKCQMTWAESPTEFIQVTFPQNNADSIDIYNGMCDFRFVEQPEEIPSKSDFVFTFTREYEGTVYEEDATLVMEQMDYDGYKSCQFYFQEKTMPGIYHVKCEYGGNFVESDFEVGEE